MEIERKYAVQSIPENLLEYPCKQIEQGYLAQNPIIRIRKSNEEYYMTYKSKFGLEQNKNQSAIINNEIELPLTESAYEHLRGKVDGNLIKKKRYLIPLDDAHMAELDIFEDKLQGLVFVEVEFPYIDAALKFKPPSWFGKDLSLDTRFSNYFLSTIANYQALGLE